MYILSRRINGGTETLKDSNSHLNKTFHDFSSANLLAKKLNANTHKSKNWQVELK